MLDRQLSFETPAGEDLQVDGGYARVREYVGMMVMMGDGFRSEHKPDDDVDDVDRSFFPIFLPFQSINHAFNQSTNR